MPIIHIAALDDYDDMSRAAADFVVQRVRRNEATVLGLAAGDTPIGLYHELVSRWEKREVDFARVRSFNLDEYVGVSCHDQHSYRYFMERHLFSRTAWKPEHIHSPNGQADDLDQECAQYERIIQESGGIDLQILGIGLNGHIGFNEPESGFDSITRVIDLTLTTRKANAKHFSSLKQVPKKAITRGLANIVQARHILLLAAGKEKVDMVFRALKEAPSPSLPASILQKHPDVTVVLSKRRPPRTD